MPLVKTHILFVDDEQPNLAVFEALCAADFAVLTAGSASEALDLMRRYQVGVVLSDQRMPDTTGVDLLEQIRAEFPDSIRMLVTAYADLGATIEAINRGHVRRYIRKPWEGSELKAALADALSLYETYRGIRMLERRLLETERVYGLGVVAASVARQLRAPAAAVSAHIKVARDALRFTLDSSPPGSTELTPLRARTMHADEALVDAAAAVDAMMSLVRGMEMPIHPRDEDVVDLHYLVRQALLIIGAELKATAKVTLELAPVPNVRGSSANLGQVVINLMVNAMRAVANGARGQPSIAIRLSAEEGWVRLAVEDNRTDVFDGDLSGLFDPLSKRERFVGTGLGLAISKKIAEELGGRMEAETRPPDRTLFRLVVPVIADEKADSA